MGGKRKRTLVKPVASRVRTPSPLPTQYDFTPNTTPETFPPVIPRRQPTVLDYPPPRQLFQTTTAPPSSASPTPQPRPSNSNPAALIAAPITASPSLQPLHPATSATRAGTTIQAQQPPHPSVLHRQSASPPSQASQNPVGLSSRSSQAQNSHTTGEEEAGEFYDEDDVPELPVEPTLSDDHMAALNSLLLGPRPTKITILDPDRIEPNSTW